jgi:predicted amidohydrolase YtcJ
MRKNMQALFLVVAATLTLPATAADLVFRNGVVYTVDAVRSWASAVAVIDNRIVYVGGEHGVEEHIDDDTRVIDLQGRMLLPGFHDSHLHPLGGGTGLTRLALDGIYDREEVFSRIRTYVEANPDLPWIIGRGWIEAPFLPEGVPNRQMLDRLVPDRPVFIRNASGHQAWVNSRALEIAGITAETPDPPNGRIDREPSGAPSGSLHEAASRLVSAHIPDETDADRERALERALDAMASYGVTTITDAGSSPESERAFASLYEQGAMTVRAVLCQRHDHTRDDAEQLREFVRRREALNHQFLRASCVKIPLDGIIEHHTSALLEPYHDQPDSRGMIFLQPERLQPLVEMVDKEGFQIHVHSIADRSTRDALDALENAIEANGFRDARPTLSHLQLVNPADIPRFRELGVIPNITPIWGRLDFWELMAIDTLGPERGEQLFLNQDYLRHGATLVWGTDWSVTTLSPLEGIETAVTRRHLGGINPNTKEPDQTWMPDQTLNLEQAIAAYTINGAYLVHAEDLTGSVETGKLADLVVLEQNLFEVSPLEIHTVNTDMTIFDGRVVYERESR